MAASPPPPLPPGTRLAHYEIRQVLASGAMGTVYVAHDLALDRAVAVKVVRPDLVGDAAAVERFLQEARAAARISHDRVTHVYFVGTTDGQPFYAMELVPGPTLDEVVRTSGPLDLARAVDVLVQAAQGLAAAHEAGIVHRDVKPSNLLVKPDGTVKVTDFGLAKSLRGDPGATQFGTLVGTPDFMSPEQCRGGAVDARTDVYGLAMTAYVLLTGERPYAGGALGALLDAHMHAPLPSVTARRPEIPAAVDRVLARLSAKDPAARPASMREVVRLLEDLRPRALTPAPLVARAFALGIDFAVYLVLVGALLWGFSQVERWTGPALLEVLGSVLGTGLAVATQFGMEARYGGSAGKLLLHLRVLAAGGGRPRRRALLARFFLRFPVAPFLLLPEAWTPPFAARAIGLLQGAALVLGAVWFLATRGRTLSDQVTRTVVAYRLPPAST